MHGNNYSWRALPAAITLTLAVSSNATATLIDRGGGLIYDDVLDITWLQDANLGGLRTWDDAVAWSDALVFGGFNDWRLPSMSLSGGLPTGSSSDVVACSGATELACRDNELGYMHHFNAVTLADPGPFQNLQYVYWSGTEFAPNPSRAFAFSFFTYGGQDVIIKYIGAFGTWAVRDGDVPASHAPEPGTLAVVGLALAGLSLAHRRRGPTKERE